MQLNPLLQVSWLDKVCTVVCKGGLLLRAGALSPEAG